MTNKTSKDHVVEHIDFGVVYPCRQCGVEYEVPDSPSRVDKRATYIIGRGENEETTDLICPECGFVNGHNYVGRMYWERSSPVPEFQEDASGDGVEHEIFDRLERLEAHIKAVEASVPAIVKEEFRRLIEASVDEEHDATRSMARNTADDVDEEILNEIAVDKELKAELEELKLRVEGLEK